MEIRTTSDSPKWSKVSMLDSEIENGLQPILKKNILNFLLIW